MNNIFYFITLSVAIVIIVTACGPKEKFAQGKNLYAVKCENCHMEDGTGLGANIPPLAQADYLKNNQDKIACIIRNGQTDSITVNGVIYDQPMEAIDGLNDVQLTNLINYINHAWGNDFGFVTVKNIQDQMKNCN